MAYLSIWAAYQAQINPGVICIIWLINPIIMAIGDLLIFGQKLKMYHIIGILSIVACGVFISLSKNADLALLADEPILPVWAAVLIAALTGTIFNCHQLFLKHLCQPRIGFNAETLTFTSYLTSSILVSICSIPYFLQNEVQTELFYYGIGTVITSMGTIFMSKGIVLGPGGPSVALSSLDGAIYSVIYAVL